MKEFRSDFFYEIISNIVLTPSDNNLAWIICEIFWT